MVLQQVIYLRDKKRKLLSDKFDNVYYFTRGNKVSLRKFGPETAKILINIDLSKLQRILANYY